MGWLSLLFSTFTAKKDYNITVFDEYCAILFGVSSLAESQQSPSLHNIVLPRAGLRCVIRLCRPVAATLRHYHAARTRIHVPTSRRSENNCRKDTALLTVRWDGSKKNSSVYSLSLRSSPLLRRAEPSARWCCVRHLLLPLLMVRWWLNDGHFSRSILRQLPRIQVSRIYTAIDLIVSRGIGVMCKGVFRFILIDIKI